MKIVMILFGALLILALAIPREIIDACANEPYPVFVDRASFTPLGSGEGSLCLGADCQPIPERFDEVVLFEEWERGLQTVKVVIQGGGSTVTFEAAVTLPDYSRGRAWIWSTRSIPGGMGTACQSMRVMLDESLSLVADNT